MSNKNTIDIGCTIDLNDLVQSRMLIQANSGGGKSVTARVIMEESFGKVPFITFDRDGEYYTLKEHFPDVVVIGGSFPDLPIAVSSAAMLPKAIIANRLSVVVDLSDLKTGEKQQYVKTFLEALMDLPQTHWTPYLIFIEEAHFFCGEQDKNPAGAAVRELMAGGRKKGFCGILITQRISKLHKDAAAECNNKFVGRTNLDIDMDRAAKELGFSSGKDRLQLRDLKPGVFFAYGTSINPHYVHDVKIKLPKTKQPKAGSVTAITPGKPTDKVLQALQKLGATAQGATKEKFEATGADKMRLEELTIRIEEWRNRYDQLQQHCAQLISKLVQIKTIVGNMPEPTTPAVNFTPAGSGETFIDQNPAKKVDKKVAVATPSAKGSLGKCPVAILQFLATYADRTFTKVQIGVATGYSPNSGGFNNALSELNSKNLILRENGRLSVNEGAAAQVLGTFEVQQYSIHTYKDKLGKCEREIYEVLLRNTKRLFSKQELAAATESQYSFNSGGFNNALSTLNTLELIKRSNGTIQLNPELLEL